MKPLDDIKKGDYVIVSKKRTMSHSEFAASVFGFSPLRFLRESSDDRFLVALDTNVTAATHGIVRSYDHPYIALTTGQGPKVLDVTGCTVEVMSDQMSSEIRRLTRPAGGAIGRFTGAIRGAEFPIVLALIFGIMVVAFLMMALGSN